MIIFFEDVVFFIGFVQQVLAERSLPVTDYSHRILCASNFELFSLTNEFDQIDRPCILKILEKAWFSCCVWKLYVFFLSTPFAHYSLMVISHLDCFVV